MNTTTATIVAAAVGGLVALATALITARTQMRGIQRRIEAEQGVERQREREKKRIQYLDPLVVAATDLLTKISRVRDELQTNQAFWTDTFREAKKRNRDDREGFAFWCNGYGAGAVTTLYVTVSYLARASKIRSELPFIELRPRDDRALLRHLNEVREAFGGEHNLWVEVQDSLGQYIIDADGRIMNYRQFCTQLIDKWDHIWYTRLLDFYGDVHLKKDELERITVALRRLIEFATEASEPRTTGAGVTAGGAC